MSVAIRSYARLLKDARVKWLVRKILGHLYAEQGRIPKNQSCPSMRGRRIRRSVKDGRRKRAQGKMLGGRISSLATLGACLKLEFQSRSRSIEGLDIPIEVLSIEHNFVRIILGLPDCTGFRSVVCYVQ